MPRRKQSNPQPVKLGVQPPDAPVLVDPSCLVLDSDFLLSGDLEFGDSEIMGLDRDTVTVFSLSVEEDSSVPADPSLTFGSCKHCGKLLPETLLSAGIEIGVGLDLSSDLSCLDCEETLRPSPSPAKSPKQVKPDRKRMTPSPATKLFSCSLCAFASRYSNHLKRHMRIHEGQKPFRCAACSYASTQLVNLQRHVRTHTGEKPYRCQTCAYACSSRGNLRRHQRTHSEQRVIRKTEAKRGKKRKSNEEQAEEVVSTLTVSQGGFLSLGSLESSSPLPALLFPVCCRVCGQTLEDEDIQTDRGDAHAEGQVCRSCSSSAPPPSESRSSRKPSKQSKLYGCPLCPFLSHYPYHLTRHIQTHDTTKAHHCPHCSYTSSHLDNLKRHLRVHTGEKPYSCSTCSYSCGNLANLRRHERVHTGAKPFHCPVCGYSCNQSMNLKRHMLRHTGHKPYECDACSYTTGHWDNYKRHQRKHGHNTDNWDKHMYKGKTQGNEHEETQGNEQEEVTSQDTTSAML